MYPVVELSLLPVIVTKMALLPLLYSVRPVGHLMPKPPVISPLPISPVMSLPLVQVGPVLL